jgi:putative metallohydrolase (TIGR04338 family)
MDPAVTPDPGRAAVYDAEGQVRALLERADATGHRTARVGGATLTLPVERRFGDVADVARYVEAVQALGWVRRLWPAAAPVRVRSRAGARMAHYADGVIAVPPRARGGAWALRELVVLHELAHHLAPGDRHGPEFVGVFVELVGRIVGPEAGQVLTVCLYEAGARLVPVAAGVGEPR